jgi:CRISPR-associated protein Csb2
MASLIIAWEYLTGKCVATNPASRERAEWPPHPGRVFMAMAAAWFETGEDEAEGQALRWLEKLGDPELGLPRVEPVNHREVQTVFVPVNDTKPSSIDKNKIAKRIAELSDEHLTAEASALSEEIDKMAKSSIAMPTILRMILLRRIRDSVELANLRHNLRQKISATDYKEFVADAIGTIPQFRSKQPRTFPSVYVGEAPCFLHWPDVPDAELQQHKPALAKLCAEVTRIGHSSSLVRMWLAEEPELNGERWIPDDGLANLHLRHFSEGTLAMLERQFNRRGRERYEQISTRITTLQAEKPAGKGSKEREAEIKAQLDSLRQELDQIDSRDPIRPKLGLWSGYRRKEAESPPATPHTDFDTDLLILTQEEGPRLPLVSTLAVTQALRGAILSHLGSDIPKWVSGHKPNGEPLRNGNQQLAIIPLPFVGHQHADGHLLGVALVFPGAIPRSERGRVLGRFLVNANREPREISLQLGRIGTITLRKADWAEPRHALRPETWTAHPGGAKLWASVTPVVLDRFPKSDPYQEREAWEEEVKAIVTTACERIGLPAPVEVAVGTTSWHRGSPRAVQKRRRLLGHDDLKGRDAPLGDGFLNFPPKGENGARPQVHACLQFQQAVVGPILLGAGRFLGYGLCKPLWGGDR